MFTRSILVSAFIILHSALAIEMREVESEHGYKMWVGQESGTDAHGAAQRAYEAMIVAGGKAKMMACTSTDGIVFCASSATDTFTPKPYPKDFKDQTKELLATCSQHTRGEQHNQGSRCAEPMLLDAMLQWTGGTVPTSKVYMYGVGQGIPGKSPAQWHAPCSDKKDQGTFGCKSMLQDMGWSWGGKKAPTPPSAGPTKADPGIPSGGSPSGASSGRTVAPLSSAATKATKSTPKGKRSLELLESELAIRALFDDLVEESNWIQARDISFEGEDLWVRDLESFLY